MLFIKITGSGRREKKYHPKNFGKEKLSENSRKLMKKQRTEKYGTKDSVKYWINTKTINSYKERRHIWEIFGRHPKISK